ncbi:hypothetical protein EWM64_g3116 [Hericium alpestre]|uniref:Uncharacterized protein n=1 Tax=Hericium alpestre TaxID=135208 RepID=A0A4Z0A364_9AGAM|nr:hypothetical protein EWM64_g3116 [Hericium alpestre]
MASLKRIHPSEDDDNNRAKRRRFSLEHGFATLNLDSNPPSSITIEEIPPLAAPRVQVYQFEPDSGFGASPTPMDTDTPPLGMPQFATPGIQGNVEEPTSPDGASMTLPDVKMHNSSWYESEKDSKRSPSRVLLLCSALPHAPGIVITDLDASSDEEDSSRPHTPESEMVISPAVMESLRRGRRTANAGDKYEEHRVESAGAVQASGCAAARGVDVAAVATCAEGRVRTGQNFVVVEYSDGC